MGTVDIGRITFKLALTVPVCGSSCSMAFYWEFTSYVICTDDGVQPGIVELTSSSDIHR